MKRLTLSSILLIILTVLCYGEQTVNNNTTFLKPKVALHYFSQGKLLKCYNPNNFNEDPTIVTNKFQALNLGIIMFTYTNYQTGISKVANAKNCLLY